MRRAGSSVGAWLTAVLRELVPMPLPARRDQLHRPAPASDDVWGDDLPPGLSRPAGVRR